MQFDLTIVSVAGPNDLSYLIKSFTLIKELNNGLKIKFFIIDNDVVSNSKFYDKIKIENLDIISKFNFSFNYKKYSNYASLEHGLSLNYFFKEYKIKSNYCLIVDPDFFIIQPNWIAHLIDNCNNEKYVLFGSTWHPKWINKYFDFPSIHFLLINLNSLNILDLDFSPNPISNLNDQKSFFKNIKLIRFFYYILYFRFKKNIGNDTGVKIFKKYKNSIKYNTLIPVVTHKDFQQIPHLNNRFGFKIENFFKGRFYSYLPKKFSDYLEIDQKVSKLLDKHTIEIFLYEKKFFAFHTRKFVKKNQTESLHDIIDQLLNFIQPTHNSFESTL